MDHLTWKNLSQALMHPTVSPRVALQLWYESGLLARELPEVHALFGIPQPPAHHPEVDTGLHTLLVVEQAWMRTKDVSIIFATLVHDLGKGVTPQDQWPKHTNHELSGVPLVQAVCDRLNAPQDATRLALLVCEYHLHAHRVFEMRPGNLIQWLDKLNFLHDHNLRQRFMLSCEADARGRTGLENREYLSPQYVETVAAVAQSSWHIGTHQERLQEAISRVKSHYAPFSDKANVKAIVRSDNGMPAVVLDLIKPAESLSC